MVMTRYTFRGELVLDGALHIGSGGGGSLRTGADAVDATVVRDSSGIPYIPGSSLRGALRAAVGQISPQLGFSEIGEDNEIRQRVADERTRLAKLTPSGTLDETGLQALLNDPAVLSPAERLFGTVWWESPLKIPDLYPLAKKTPEGEVRHGVGIDRDTGAARDGAKYDFEVLARGLRFGFSASLELADAPPTHAAEWPQLVGLGLRLLELGEIRLGGRHARGAGQVRLEGLTVYLLDFGDRGQLLKALKREDPAGPAGTLQPDWLTQQLAGVT